MFKFSPDSKTITREGTIRNWVNCFSTFKFGNMYDIKTSTYTFSIHEDQEISVYYNNEFLTDTIKNIYKIINNEKYEENTEEIIPSSPSSFYSMKSFNSVSLMNSKEKETKEKEYNEYNKQELYIIKRPVFLRTRKMTIDPFTLGYCFCKGFVKNNEYFINLDQPHLQNFTGTFLDKRRLVASSKINIYKLICEYKNILYDSIFRHKLSFHFISYDTTDLYEFITGIFIGNESNWIFLEDEKTFEVLGVILNILCLPFTVITDTFTIQNKKYNTFVVNVFDFEPKTYILEKISIQKRIGPYIEVEEMDSLIMYNGFELY